MMTIIIICVMAVLVTPHLILRAFCIHVNVNSFLIVIIIIVVSIVLIIIIVTIIIIIVIIVNIIIIIAISLTSLLAYLPSSLSPFEKIYTLHLQACQP